MTIHTINELITKAIRNGNTKIVRQLLAWRGPKGQWVDPTTDDNNPIINAAYKGNPEIVKILLNWRSPGDERVDPTA